MRNIKSYEHRRIVLDNEGTHLEVSDDSKEWLRAASYGDEGDKYEGWIDQLTDDVETNGDTGVIFIRSRTDNGYFIFEISPDAKEWIEQSREKIEDNTVIDVMENVVFKVVTENGHKIMTPHQQESL